MYTDTRMHMDTGGHNVQCLDDACVYIALSYIFPIHSHITYYSLPIFQSFLASSLADFFSILSFYFYFSLSLSLSLRSSLSECIYLYYYNTRRQSHSLFIYTLPTFLKSSSCYFIIIIVIKINIKTLCLLILFTIIIMF